MLLVILIICILIIVLLACVGYFNAKMDHVKEYQLDKHSWRYKYQWYTINTHAPIESKYLPVVDTNLITRLPFKSKWYYPFGLFAPTFTEAFPLSVSALVWLTDPWHKYKMLMFTCSEAIGTIPLVVLMCYYYETWWILLIIPLVILLMKAVRGLFFNIERLDEVKDFNK